MVYPKITVITPSYNQGDFIEETICSVLDQNYPNLEYFVIDGGSKDNTVAIIKKYAECLSYWVSEKDSGQSEAINKGFKRATGEIVTWLNSDDVLMPGCLQEVANVFQTSNDNVGLVYGGVELFEGQKVLDRNITRATPSKEAFAAGMVFSQPSSFFKRSYLEQVGYLEPSFHLGLDYDLFARLNLVCDFAQTNKTLARYRLHDSSKSVLEHSSFINDWSAVFTHLCKNLGWENSLSVLHNFGVTYKAYPDYTFTPIFFPNEQKSLFFHLAHLVKFSYWDGSFDRAKWINDYMVKNFETTWFSEDPRYFALQNKLKLPSWLLTLYRQTISKIIN